MRILQSMKTELQANIHTIIFQPIKAIIRLPTVLFSNFFVTYVKNCRHIWQAQGLEAKQVSITEDHDESTAKRNLFDDLLIGAVMRMAAFLYLTEQKDDCVNFSLRSIDLSQIRNLPASKVGDYRYLKYT